MPILYIILSKILLPLQSNNYRTVRFVCLLAQMAILIK